MIWGRMGSDAGEKAAAEQRDQSLEDNTMRVAAGLILASAMSLGLASAAWSQTPAAKPAAAAQSAPPAAAPAPQATAPAAAAAQQPARAACNNPNALGVARTVEIDTTGGPGFGFSSSRSASTRPMSLRF
jgi:hypothetical protein